MGLNDTVEMMGSSDYKERFRAEYLQLKNRMNGGLGAMKKYKEGGTLIWNIYLLHLIAVTTC